MIYSLCCRSLSLLYSWLTVYQKGRVFDSSNDLSCPLSLLLPAHADIYSSPPSVSPISTSLELTEQELVRSWRSFHNFSVHVRALTESTPAFLMEKERGARVWRFTKRVHKAKTFLLNCLQPLQSLHVLQLLHIIPLLHTLFTTALYSFVPTILDVSNPSEVPLRTSCCWWSPISSVSVLLLRFFLVPLLLINRDTHSLKMWTQKISCTVCC